ncbi:molybdate ABC transporter substrate-binding protein [Acuticoccus sediminis]|uniref:molybdate ABC transporter substrate-binding protein n=1 Tax=Acuticoccus sediminis TaxID=2184697 RepID=UPI001CFF2120|nr:molybdate ABC transporter substrate-binding protein [Acuticoccus sediminis]
MLALTSARAAAAALLTSALLFGAPGRAAADEVIAAVAANFTDATREIAAAFQEATGHTVSPSFASSGKLFAQISHGAPFQVFLSADTEKPERAEADGLAVAGTRFPYASGRLVLWSAASGAFDDGAAYLAAGNFAHVAIANPKTAPYGAAALEVLEKLGVATAVAAKLVTGDNITQAFQFIATGNAEAGFVAASQVIAWDGAKGTLWEIPAELYSPILQEAVLLKPGEASEAARAFLAFLSSDAAREIIARHGYGLPSGPEDVALLTAHE